MPTIFKTLNTGSISAGSYAEAEWTPNVQVYISIADVPYTKDFVPGAVIGSNIEYCWKPDLRVPKGAKIYVKATNSTAGAVDLDIVFEYE
ncbi:MAG: hypothetical protein JRC53_04500 [Deltaproteobacteria bacterium]|nr:hypothetical protein [Deltaproteobacteria bacterium]